MSTTQLTDREDVREIVRQKYGEAALRIMKGEGSSCCGGGGDTCCGDEKTDGCCSNGTDQITSNLYTDTEASEIPEAALLARAFPASSQLQK
jgi:arsenite methyltransferase